MSQDGTQEALHADAPPDDEEAPKVQAEVTRLPYAAVQGGLYVVTIALTVAMVVLLWMVRDITKEMSGTLGKTKTRIDALEKRVSPAARRAPPFLDEGRPVMRAALPVLREARPFLGRTTQDLRVTVDAVQRMDRAVSVLTEPAVPTLRRLESVDVAGFIRTGDRTLGRLGTLISDPSLPVTLHLLNTLLGDAVGRNILVKIERALRVAPKVARGISAFRRFANTSLGIQKRLRAYFKQSLRLQRSLLVYIKRIDTRLGGPATVPPTPPTPPITGEP